MIKDEQTWINIHPLDTIQAHLTLAYIGNAWRTVLQGSIDIKHIFKAILKSEWNLKCWGAGKAFKNSYEDSLKHALPCTFT